METGVLEVWGFWGLVWGWGGLSGDWKSRPSRGASGVEGGSVVTGAGDEVGASWGAGDELFSGKSLPSHGLQLRTEFKTKIKSTCSWARLAPDGGHFLITRLCLITRIVPDDYLIS